MGETENDSEKVKMRRNESLQSGKIVKMAYESNFVKGSLKYHLGRKNLPNKLLF